MRGGVSLLSILLLSLSLIFTACSDGGDDNSNPSPTLPANQGTNPVDKILGEGSTGTGEETDAKSIKLISYDDSDHGDYATVLELKNDGTATMHTRKNTEDYPPYSEFEYSYAENEIYMRLSKCTSDITYDDGLLYTYDELISQANEYFEMENYKKALEQQFNEYQNKEWFQNEYPDCNTYKKYEDLKIKEGGFKSLDEMIADEKKYLTYCYDMYFSPKVTYTYEIKSGKMTLTEEFTGIMNILLTNCRYENIDYNDNNYVHSLGAGSGYITLTTRDYDYYTVSFDKSKKEAVLCNSSDKTDKITATYKEDIPNATVTVTINDERYRGEYPCKFEGSTYTQEV